MWAILLTTMLILGHGVAVSTAQVGSYQSAQTCNLIASQLKEPEQLLSGRYTDTMTKIVTARCVQVTG